MLIFFELRKMPMGFVWALGCDCGSGIIQAFIAKRRGVGGDAGR